MRAGSLQPILGFLDHAGVQTGRWLDRARVPQRELAKPAGLISLPSTYRFLELVARHEDMSDLGPQAAARITSFSLGGYGQTLQLAATVREYLVTGASRVTTMENQGLSIWLASEGTSIRVNQVLAGCAGIGGAVADSYVLMVTIGTLQKMLGADWWPDEIGLRQDTDALLGSRAAQFSGRVRYGLPHSYFTLPRETLCLPNAASITRPGQAAGTVGAPPPLFPTSFAGSAERLLEALLGEGITSIDIAAEAAGMSRRQFQRRLAESGTSFSSLLTTLRMRHARDWLANSEISVAELAAELAYTDDSNFARAFRRETGLAPAAYRKSLKALH